MMLFKNDSHEKFYNTYVDKTNSHNDSYRKALFYTLGLTGDTRRNINRLYDFKEKGINFDGLFDSWQTSGSLRVSRLAFNLYNGFAGDIGDGRNEDADLYTPYNLFDCEFAPYFWEAIKIRYDDIELGRNELCG